MYTLIVRRLFSYAETSSQNKEQQKHHHDKQNNKTRLEANNDLKCARFKKIETRKQLFKSIDFI